MICKRFPFGIYYTFSEEIVTVGQCLTYDKLQTKSPNA